MIKKLTLLAAALAVAGLTGCSIPKRPTGIELPEPRPTTDETSYAMKAASAIKTTVNCLGCRDTALWADETDWADKMVFDPEKTTAADYALMRAYKARVEKLKKEGMLTEETMPKPPRVMLNMTESSVDTLTTSLMLADSVDGMWTNSNASVGAGLALAAVSSLLSTKQDENLDHPPVSYLKAAFVLPADIEKRAEKIVTTPKATDEQKLRANISIHAGKEFVKLLTKRAVEMGFKPAGNIEVEYASKPENGDVLSIYQLLENDALGCPKVDFNDMSFFGRHGYCRVEWGPYRPLGVREAYSWKIDKEPVPKILGGDGKTERWIGHFGYNQLGTEPLDIFVSDVSTIESFAYQHRFMMGLQKYLKPGQIVYVPSIKYIEEREGSREWKLSPQAVLDHKGTHYFTVVVPQKRPVLEAPVAEAKAK